MDILPPALKRARMDPVERGTIRVPGFDPEWADQTPRPARIILILGTVCRASSRGSPTTARFASATGSRSAAPPATGTGSSPRLTRRSTPV